MVWLGILINVICLLVVILTGISYGNLPVVGVVAITFNSIGLILGIVSLYLKRNDRCIEEHFRAGK